MLHAVIMAGGAGTRFWPASRMARPKQLLDLAGKQTMIQATVSRFGDLVQPERTMIVTNENYVGSIARQLPELPAECLIGEPCKRDTAPCIALAAALVRRVDEEGVMVVAPADHVIQPVERFQAALRSAAGLVEERPTRIVTLGIPPTFPAENFGYIERGPALDADTEFPTFAVNRFREKPSTEAAREYLSAGGFYWNSGIFIWKAATILDALREFEPQMCAHIDAIVSSLDEPDFDEVFQREFAAIKGKSIDYAVMERYDDVAVIEAPFQWDDVGSWGAIARLHPQDADGNTSIGKHLGIDTRRAIVRSDEHHLVVTVGMEDCIVVHTPDATLVARRDQEETLRMVVQQLQEKGWEEYL